MTGEISKEKVQKMNQLIKNGATELEQKPVRDHDFSFLEEPNQKQDSVMSRHLKRRIKSYTSSRIKTRNLLSNIYYTGVKSDDFVDNNFTFDTINLITKNINPFSLERKTENEQSLEKNIVSKQLQEKRLKRKALAEKKYSLKRVFQSLSQRLLKKSYGAVLKY